MVQALAGSSTSPATGGGTSTLVQLISSWVRRSSGTARLRLNSNGAAEQRTENVFGATYSTLFNWLLSGVNSDYQCYATLTGGNPLVAGTLNTWLPLSSTQAWDADNSTLTIQIRQTTTGNVLATGVFTLFNS